MDCARNQGCDNVDNVDAVGTGEKSDTTSDTLAAIEDDPNLLTSAGSADSVDSTASENAQEPEDGSVEYESSDNSSSIVVNQGSAVEDDNGDDHGDDQGTNCATDVPIHDNYPLVHERNSNYSYALLVYINTPERDSLFYRHRPDDHDEAYSTSNKRQRRG
ncbi:hypothetical protein B7463_g2895, partial [Scytalidium lignicola]